MKRNLLAMLVVSAGAMLAQYRDGYGQYGGSGGDRDRGGYAAYDDADYRQDGWVAPAPPPPPAAAYGYFRRPPMPGPGCAWVDSHWSFSRGRYVWVPGFWARPPYAGGYWMAPRYDGRRFFGGFWAGGRGGGGAGFGYGSRGGGRYSHGRRW